MCGGYVSSIYSDLCGGSFFASYTLTLSLLAGVGIYHLLSTYLFPVIHVAFILGRLILRGMDVCSTLKRPMTTIYKLHASVFFVTFSLFLLGINILSSVAPDSILTTQVHSNAEA